MLYEVHVWLDRARRQATLVGLDARLDRARRQARRQGSILDATEHSLRLDALDAGSTLILDTPRRHLDEARFLDARALLNPQRLASGRQHTEPN